jgi:hypothetical protein
MSPAFMRHDIRSDVQAAFAAISASKALSCGPFVSTGQLRLTTSLEFDELLTGTRRMPVVAATVACSELRLVANAFGPSSLIGPTRGIGN